jgi:small subunit ribosomal protein S16
VAVKIKLKRMGKIRAPYYRIIVADARTKRDGRAIEEIGKYHPKVDPSLIEVDSDRAQYWLSVGAQPTDPVRKLLEITGDWQRFKGLPGAEGTLKSAEAGPDKKAAFAAAVAETVKAADGKAEKGRGRRPAASSEKAEGAGKGKAAAGEDVTADSGEDGKAARPAKGERADKADKGERADKPAARQSGGKQAKSTQANAAAGEDEPAAEEPAAGQGSEA